MKKHYGIRYIHLALFDYMMIFTLFCSLPYLLAVCIAIISNNSDFQVLIVNVYYVTLITITQSDWFINISRTLIHKHATDPTDDNTWNVIFERKFCNLFSYLAYSYSKTFLYAIYLITSFINILIEAEIVKQIPFESHSWVSFPAPWGVLVTKCAISRSLLRGGVSFNSTKYGIILLICVDRLISSIEKNKTRKKKYMKVYENYTYNMDYNPNDNL